MTTTTYIPDVLANAKDPRGGHLKELDRRVQQSFEDLKKLETLPNTEALRLRLNEKQFGDRLEQTREPARRLAILNEQRKLRANYASAVLLAHEAHRDVQCTWNFMAILLPGSMADNSWSDKMFFPFHSQEMGNLATLAMLHREHCPDPDATAALLNSVPEVAPDVIITALRSLFDDIYAANSEACFAEPLDFNFIELRSCNVARINNLSHAYKQAAEAWARYESVRAQYVSAKAALNEPQFAQRLEQAIRSGSQQKEQEVVREHNQARVQFYCAALACNHYYDQLSTTSGTLLQALEAAVQGIDGSDLDQYTIADLNSLLRDKVRNNCICATILMDKITRQAIRPDLSRLDDKIFQAVRAAVDSFRPLLDTYRAAMLDSLG